jgi:hypothetical protein
MFATEVFVDFADELLKYEIPFTAIAYLLPGNKHSRAK